MLRPQAVEDLLYEDVAKIRTPAADTEQRCTALGRAHQRALLVVAFDWLAIALLFFWRDPLARFLSLGPSEESIFTLAILAVATHSGFRLGQLERYRAVESAIRSLRRFC